MASIKVEYTLSCCGAMLGIGNESWFNVKRYGWMYAKIIWMNDRQLKIQKLEDGQAFILLPKSIIEIQDKAPY